MKKRCRGCKQDLDSSSFCQSSREPDGLAQICSSCVNKRRRKRYATKSSQTGQERPAHLGELVKKGDCAAIKRNEGLINAGNRQRLLALAVTDFKSAPKTLGHLELVKFLIELGARPDFHLVCAATVGPHIDIMNALIEAGAEHNIFTAAALGDVDRVREWLAIDATLADKTTDYDVLGERDMTALDYACRSELGKINQAYADQLLLCAEQLLDRKSAPRAQLDRGIGPHGFGNPLSMCASRGGNAKIAQLLIGHGWQPSVATVLAALGHFQRHGRGNYDVAALCLEAGVDINEMDGRTLLHAFAHQGDIVGTRWLVERGAKIDARDVGNNTPLHKACERNSTLAVVKLLLERGASLTATNNNGETALDVATKNDKKNIATYLQHVGAKHGVPVPVDRGRA
jgi:ankyrin repeat protein